MGKTPSLVGSVRVWFTSSYVRAVMPTYYVGETSRHLSTRVREHLVSDRTSHATPDQYERTVPIWSKNSL